MLLERGVNPKVVQKLLGHRDIETTLGTYSHVLPEVFDCVARVVGELHADMTAGNIIEAPTP
jgi:site-specific recombinase XerD